MQKKGAIILFLLLVIVIILSILLKDEEQESAPLPVENTTEVLGKKDTSTQEESRFKLKKDEDIILHDTAEQKTIIPTAKNTTGTFTLINTKDESHNITISDQSVKISRMEKPIVIINLFATWCPPCIGEIPYLNDLQKKHQNELFIAGILTNDMIDKASLESFMAKEQINYFISHAKQNNDLADLMAEQLNLDKNFSIPLTVMYLKGEYFTHYEGTVPVEMIEYDIQQAKKQLN